jgi:hypothetical protein
MNLLDQMALDITQIKLNEKIVIRIDKMVIDKLNKLCKED